jgi:hypothetical protein
MIGGDMGDDEMAPANGRVSIREVYDLVDKVYVKVDTVHRESMVAIGALDDKLDAHAKEATVRDRRLDRLEDWKEGLPAFCDYRMTQLVETEHEERHGDHMTRYIHFTKDEYKLMMKETLQEAKEEFVQGQKDLGTKMSNIEKRVWVMWAVGLFVVTSLASTFGDDLIRLIVVSISKSGG